MPVQDRSQTSGAQSVMKLLGKTAVVTGAARGLGRAYALRLASLGADVAIVDVDLAAAAEFGETLKAASVAEEIVQMGRRGFEFQADLTKQDEARSAILRAHEALGRIDILVNNAGGALSPAERSRASESPEEDTRFMLDVNYMSAVYCCQTVAPIIKAQHGGVIVNISSQSGIYGISRACLPPISTAKAALTHYTRYLGRRTRAARDLRRLPRAGRHVDLAGGGAGCTARRRYQRRSRARAAAPARSGRGLRRRAVVPDHRSLQRRSLGQVISVCGGAVLTPN